MFKIGIILIWCTLMHFWVWGARLYRWVLLAPNRVCTEGPQVPYVLPVSEKTLLRRRRPWAKLAWKTPNWGTRLYRWVLLEHIYIYIYIYIYILLVVVVVVVSLSWLSLLLSLFWGARLDRRVLLAREHGIRELADVRVLKLAAYDTICYSMI